MTTEQAIKDYERGYIYLQELKRIEREERLGQQDADLFKLQALARRTA